MDLQIKQELGSGAFGTVYLAKDRDGNIYAVKEQYEITLPELQCGYLDHPNLLKYIKVYEEEPGVKIVASPVGTSLVNIINNVNISLEDRYQIIKDVISGLYHMHINGFIHQDLGLNNIIMTQDRRGVIIDFGHSIYGRNKLEGDKYVLETSFDLYALGVIIFELLTRQTVTPKLDLDKIRNLYKLSKVTDHEFWAMITHKLLKRQLNTDQLARIFSITGRRLPLEPLNLTRDIKYSYEQVLRELDDPDFYWLPYYLVVYMTTIYATTNLKLNKVVGMILDLYDSGERNITSNSNVINNKIVRPIVIETLDDAIKVHDLLKSGDPNYYYLDLHQSFDTPLATLGDIVKLN